MHPGMSEDVPIMGEDVDSCGDTEIRIDSTQEGCTHAHVCTVHCEDKYLLNYVNPEPKGAPAKPKTHDPTNPATKPASIPAPRNRREALQSPWWPGYYKAELAEMKSHADMETSTCNLVARCCETVGHTATSWDLMVR